MCVLWRHAAMGCRLQIAICLQDPHWLLLLAAIPTPASPRQYELAYARPTGPWLPFATLEVTQARYRGHDLDLSFDPLPLPLAPRQFGAVTVLHQDRISR
jgi:hypothetical protein